MVSTRESQGRLTLEGWSEKTGTEKRRRAAGLDAFLETSKPPRAKKVCGANKNTSKHESSRRATQADQRVGTARKRRKSKGSGCGVGEEGRGNKKEISRASSIMACLEADAGSRLTN